MSVNLTHDVFCDECGQWIHAFVSHKAQIRKAREYAKRGGWAYIWTPEGYRDLCPDCAKDLAPMNELKS